MEVPLAVALLLICCCALWLANLEARVSKLEARFSCDRCNNRMKTAPGAINRLCGDCHDDMIRTQTFPDTAQAPG